MTTQDLCFSGLYNPLYACQHGPELDNQLAAEVGSRLWHASLPVPPFPCSAHRHDLCLCHAEFFLIDARSRPKALVPPNATQSVHCAVLRRNLHSIQDLQTNVPNQEAIYPSDTVQSLILTLSGVQNTRDPSTFCLAYLQDEAFDCTAGSPRL